MENKIGFSFDEWVRRSVGLRLFTIGFLVLVLLIPAAMIQSTVRERESRRVQAVYEIASKWGSAQTLSGPWLTIPYRYSFKNDKGVVMTDTRLAYFLPESLDVKGRMLPEVRYRGMYEAVLYRTSVSVQAHFNPPDFSAWNVAPENILWTDAQLAYGITDMKGIRTLDHVKWNNQTLMWNPGIEKPGVVTSGVSTRLKDASAARPATFSMTLELNGSENLQFLPFGKTTTVQLDSAWKAPSFQGNFLPTERSVTDKGFQAVWKVLHLNRNYPQAWIQPVEANVENSAFGVSLKIPADQYQKTSRSSKYAVLFILLTFGTIFLLELKRRQSVHVMQYLLIGLALVLFYSLLLSLVEHLGFGKAYLLASLSILSLIGLYAKGIFQSHTAGWGTGALIGVLYGYLYTLLQLEDYSLLIGNLGLFASLAAAMYVSRRADALKRN